MHTHSNRPAELGGVLGKDAERTDEKNLRSWCEEVASSLGDGAYALQPRNDAFARDLIRRHGGDDAGIPTIQEAY